MLAQPTTIRSALRRRSLSRPRHEIKRPFARCTYPEAPLSPDLISIVASGGWLLDQAQPVRENSSLRLGRMAVGFDFPLPPQPRGTYIDGDGESVSLGPPYQGGLLIAVTLEPGLRYVTDILGYGSG